MLQEWLRAALRSSGITQTELAKRLTMALGRSIDKVAVNTMVSGQRRLLAEELIEIARICGCAMPTDLGGGTSELSRALSAIRSAADFNDLGVSSGLPVHDSDYVQVKVSDLRTRLRSAFLIHLPATEENIIGIISSSLVASLQQSSNSVLIHRIEPISPQYEDIVREPHASSKLVKKRAKQRCL